MAWFPEDGNSLPTPLEYALATEAINELRNEMDQTSAKARQLEQELQKTQAKAEQLKQEIFKRVVWLAPIRRIPAEVLSMFFIQACEDNWKAPLILGAVSRRWRNVLIETPRAWVFIQITPKHRLFRHSLLDLWLSRCGAIKIDASLPRHAPPEVVDVIGQHERNLQCLSFFGSAKQLRGQYTQLEELRLGEGGYDFFSWEYKGNEESASKKDVDLNFPKLVSLHLHSPSDAVMGAIARKSHLPSLQELHIHASGFDWLRIIKCCADTLIILRIEQNRRCMDAVPKDEFDIPILLPQLQELHFVRIGRSARWPALQTPHLQSYHEYYGQGISPLHSDVSMVTSLLLYEPGEVAWSSFPSVTRLEIRDTPSAILRDMTTLTNNASLCPRISSVTCVAVGSDVTHEPLIALYMAARSGRTGISIGFHYRKAERDPTEITCPCFTFCPSHSDPKQPFWDPYNEGFHHVRPEENEEEEEEDYDAYEDYESYGHSDDWGNSSDAQEYFERLRYS